MSQMTVDEIAAGLVRIGVPADKALEAANSHCRVRTLSGNAETRATLAAKFNHDKQFAPFWTPERDATLADLYLSTEHKDIASALGTTAHAVRSRCSILGLNKNRRWSDEQLNEVAIWYQSRAGKPLHLKELAARMGRTRYDVCTMAKRLGLTSKDRPKPPEYVATLSERTRAAWKKQPHPRGMLGKRHTAETKKRISDVGLANPRTFSDEERQAASDRMFAKHATTPAANVYSRCRHGRRPDLGDVFFRSSWEANYARYLNLLMQQGIIASWEYEPDTFWFEAIRRGVRSYKPDFKVTEPDGSVHYDEVKGWLDAKSKTKLARMKKYHPSIDVRLVDAKAYREIARTIGRGLPGWEAPR